ncbi:DNA-processing protein DprA [Salinicoccus bachuensis]|uniref:DNA-processing protein DprA n=1 Tax=Salinicoccus bachuensis TaxID=3136731 RepID=A0ABZ3CMD0_9STAP
MDLLSLSFAGVTPHEYKVLAHHGNMGMTRRIREKVSRAGRMDRKRITGMLKAKGIGHITMEDAAYPSLLKQIYDPPLVLYYRGDTSLLENPMLGIVGSRKATGYTRLVLQNIIPDLGGMVVVSGLAYGADDMAHNAAMTNGLGTVGVLAFGHDVHYPRSTAGTRDRMEREGLVISEYPPDVQIAKWRFVARNRIIAGLSSGVLVTEAEASSGSLITLDMALNENRNAYCIPGNIHAPQSAGTNERLREGAKMVLSGADIMEDFRS